MAKSNVFKTNVPAGSVSFNVVPLVDCCFLMILFFILTSQMSAPGSILHLATPTDSQALPSEQSKMTNKFIVSVISAEENPDPARKGEAYLDPNKAGQALRYEVLGGEHIDLHDNTRLVATFKRAKSVAISKGSSEKDFYIIIRADWRVRYADVVPIFSAASEAQIPKMNITVMKSGPAKT